LIKKIAFIDVLVIDAVTGSDYVASSGRMVTAFGKCV